MNLKRTTADALFSNYIRLRDNYTCQKCGKHIPPPTSYIHCSHLYSRKWYATRFDESNAIALCGSMWPQPGGCHGYFEGNPVAHRNFFYKRLGKKRFDKLFKKHNKSLKEFYPNMKEQEKAMRILYRRKIEELKSNEPQIFGAR